jgi:hypothetical protein
MASFKNTYIPKKNYINGEYTSKTELNEYSVHYINKLEIYIYIYIYIYLTANKSFNYVTALATNHNSQRYGGFNLYTLLLTRSQYVSVHKLITRLLYYIASLKHK